MVLIERLNGIADGENQVFNVRHGVPAPGSVVLFRDAQLDMADQFQLRDQTITFSSAPAANSVLTVKYKPLDDGASQLSTSGRAPQVGTENLEAAVQREVRLLHSSSSFSDSAVERPSTSRLQAANKTRVASTALLERVLHESRRTHGSPFRRSRDLQDEDDPGVEGFVGDDDTNVFTLPLLRDTKKEPAIRRGALSGDAVRRPSESLSSIRLLSRTLSETDDADDQ